MGFYCLLLLDRYTLEQVAEYVAQRGSPVDPQGFIDFYESKGWMVGKTPMKDWKAACRNAEGWDRWKKSGQQPGKKNGPFAPAENDSSPMDDLNRMQQYLERQRRGEA